MPVLHNFLSLLTNVLNMLFDELFQYVCAVCSVEGGELFGRIKAKKQLEEEIAKLYFYQMLRAVEVHLYERCFKQRLPLNVFIF